MTRILLCSCLLAIAVLCGPHIAWANAQDTTPNTPVQEERLSVPKSDVVIPPRGVTTMEPAPGQDPNLLSPRSVETESLNLQTEQPLSPTTKAIDPAEIPEILMQEVKEMENVCTSNYLYSSFHDCRCIAVKFLDARIKADPSTSRDAVFKQVAAQCVNKVSIIGYIYPSCYDIMKLHYPDSYRSICECTANKVAEDYALRPIVNIRYIEGLRKAAFRQCGMSRVGDN